MDPVERTGAEARRSTSRGAGDASEERRPRARHARRGLALLLGTVLTLLLGELGVRLWVRHENGKLLQNALAAPGASGVELARGTRVSLRDVIRPSAYERVIYEMKPHLPGVVYARATLETNAAGFRDGPYAERKPPGTVRVLGLGDSVMFGQGVEVAEAYASVLEVLLNGEHPERAWEVINTAVPGYNTAMEVATLERRGLPYEPDLVLLGFVSNDLQLPDFIRNEEDWLDLGKSFLLTFLDGRLRGLGERDTLANSRPRPAVPRGPVELAPLRGDGFEPSPLSDPDNVPGEYRDMVGRGALERGLTRLAELREQHGFEVLVFTNRTSPESRLALELARERGLSTFDLTPTVERVMRESSIEEYFGSALTLSERDPHPSAWQHRIAARALLDQLVESGLLERIASGAASGE